MATPSILARKASAYGFGVGWHEGLEVGISRGWDNRDAIARSELATAQAKTDAAQAALNAAMARLADRIGEEVRHMEAATATPTRRIRCGTSQRAARARIDGSPA